MEEVEGLGSSCHRGHIGRAWKLLNFKGIMWVWERGNGCGPKM